MALKDDKIIINSHIESACQILNPLPGNGFRKIRVYILKIVIVRSNDAPELKRFFTFFDKVQKNPASSVFAGFLSDLR